MTAREVDKQREVEETAPNAQLGKNKTRVDQREGKKSRSIGGGKETKVGLDTDYRGYFPFSVVPGAKTPGLQKNG